MSGNAKCVFCGAEIPADAPERLCRACLLKSALDDSGDGHAPRGQARAHNPDDGGTVTYCVDAPDFSSQRYAERKFHARGAMGEVWRVLDTQINRVVALKTLRKRGTDNQQRFLAEAQITGQLEHPNVVPVHDLGVDQNDGEVYYTMRFLDGQTLDDVIDDFHESRKSPGERALALRGLLEHFLDACDAVHYAHKRGVVHRDIKPDNIVVGTDGETWVVDWGLAKVADQPELSSLSGISVTLTSSGASTEKRSGSVLGTPAYMPPELAEGHGAEAGPTCDVYLLGATLYKILTNRAPRRGSTHQEVIEMARTMPPVPPREIDKTVPRALEAICLRAMARKPANRYQSARELAEDLRRYLAYEPVVAYPEPLLERCWRWVWRHRQVLTRAAGAAAAVILLAAATWLYLRTRQHALEAVARADRLAAIDTAEDQVRNFRALRDQALYVLGEDSHDPRFSYYRATEGLGYLQDALSVSQPWGEQLDALPLVAEREQLRWDLYDLLVLRVFTRMLATDAPDAALVTAMSEDLERAERLAGGQPGAEFYRLRARCRRLRQDDGAWQDEQKMEVAAKRAMDYFVLGESHRRRKPLVDPSDPVDGPRTRDLNQAIGAYQDALRLSPDHFWSLLQLGRCYLSQRELAEAEGALRACVALRPESPYAYSVRGLVLAQAARYEEALADLDFALRINPEFHPARLNRGWVQLRMGRFENAEADLVRVLRESPLSPAAYCLGRLYFERGDYAQARQYFSGFADESPGFAAVQKDLATVDLLSGNDQPGLDGLARYLDLIHQADRDVVLPNTYLYRGVFLRSLVSGPLSEQLAAVRNELQVAGEADRQHLAQKAGGLARRSVELLTLSLAEISHAETEISTADLYYEKSAVLKLLRQPQEEMAAYSRGLEIDPNHLGLLRQRGFRLLSDGKSAEAMLDLERAVLLRPGSQRDTVLLADSHALLGYLLAEKDRVQRQRAPLGTHALLGYLLSENDDNSRAQRLATLALLALDDVSPDNGSVYKETYTVLINTATIYGVLAKSSSEEGQPFADLALTLLERVVPIAKRFHETSYARRLIEGEAAFESLRDSERYQKILERLTE